MIRSWWRSLATPRTGQKAELLGSCGHLLSPILGLRESSEEAGESLRLPFDVRTLSRIRDAGAFLNGLNDLPYSADSEVEDSLVAPSVLAGDEVDGSGVTTDNGGVGVEDPEVFLSFS